MRSTRQREVIRKVVCGTDCHPSADEVYEEVRKELPGISLGTVYRNLKLLAQQGELQVLTGLGGVCRYDACTRIHYHFICDCCGRVFDLDLSPGIDLESAVTAATGFEVRCHTIQFRGVCDACCEAARTASDPDGRMP